MKSAYEIQNEIDAQVKEIAMVKAMSESEVCEYGNTDSKAEYIEACEDELKALKYQLDCALDEEEFDSPERDYSGLDPAFSSWGEVNGQFYHL